MDELGQCTVRFGASGIQRRRLHTFYGSWASSAAGGLRANGDHGGDQHMRVRGALGSALGGWRLRAWNCSGRGGALECGRSRSDDGWVPVDTARTP